MKLREFSERILMTDSLEAKLAPPEPDLRDDDPGPALAAPRLPGRPAELRPRREGARASFPGRHALEHDEEQRGLLLHFFANHELLATELMALVLLKFPDAPAAFRRGVLNTLVEEQHHTRWYLERMRECGVRFGDFPVSGYFWEAVAPMETPLDYVSRLSLTFEQANLDYSKHYAEIFRSVGDTKTASILERIYRDEIGHVGYGLKWFRRWKEEGESDWEAYRKHLIFPLSPGRAKANGARFNQEGRLAAGFDPEFVDSLEVFARSKGRTPNVFCFFPDEEAAMVSGWEEDARAYQAGREVAAIASDLEILPAFLARRDDVVLMRRPPSDSHLRFLQECGFDLPEFEGLAGASTLAADSLTRERKLHGLRPWSWGPQSACLLKPLLPNLPGEDCGKKSCWNPGVRTVFSKAWDVALLERLVRETGTPEPGIIGRVCRSREEVETTLREIKSAGFESAMLKAPFGASARKNHRLAIADWGREHPIRVWAGRIMESQGEVVVEPWLARSHDFSVHYRMDHEEGMRRLGAVRLFNDTRGQFVAAQCEKKFCRGMEPAEARFFMEDALPQFEEGGALATLLEEGLRDAGYEGPVGVDAMIYKSPGGSGSSGRMRLKPVVEVNPRFTMGRVALELMRRVAPGHGIRFELIAAADAVQDELTREKPVLNGGGKLAGGTVILNEVSGATRTLAVLRVGSRGTGE